ncbi:MAG: sulfate transporter CysZ [Nitrospiria bacterium]
MNIKPDSFLTGARYFLRGFHIIQRPGIRRYVLLPLSINTVLFSLLIAWGTGQFNHLLKWLLPTWLDWLSWLLWPLFAAIVSVLVFSIFIHLGNLLSAPFCGPLSEAVEAHLKGLSAKRETDWQTIFLNLWPSLVSEFKKIVYFILRGIPLLILFIIPVMNLIAPFLWIIFSAWMISLEYVDFPMSNHGLLFEKQRKQLQEKRFMVFGFGGATLLMLMVPGLNFLTMPTAVAGATVMWVEQFEDA